MFTSTGWKGTVGSWGLILHGVIGAMLGFLAPDSGFGVDPGTAFAEVSLGLAALGIRLKLGSLIYFLGSLLVALLAALAYSFRQGRQLGKLKTEVIEGRRWRIAQGKAIHALGKAIEHEADLRKLSDRVQNATDIDELNLLYDEIVGRASRPSE